MLVFHYIWLAGAFHLTFHFRSRFHFHFTFSFPSFFLFEFYDFALFLRRFVVAFVVRCRFVVDPQLELMK